MMAGPAAKLALCVVDSLLRRVVLPLVVLAGKLLLARLFHCQVYKLYIDTALNDLIVSF